MTSDADELVRLSADPRKWGSSPAPQDLEIASILTRLHSAEDFWALGRQVDLGVARMLNSFAQRMAALAASTRDPVWVIHGVKAAQLAMFGEDDREVLRSYALLFRAAQLAGADARNLFTEHSFLLGEAETPEQFGNRTADTQTIECMGFVEERDASSGRIHWRSR